MDITSLQNPRIKHLVKLREDKRQRQKDDLMLVEGYDEIQLAVHAGHMPMMLLIAPELAAKDLNIPHAESLTVSRPVFEKISYRENPDGYMGVFSIPMVKLDDLKLSRNPLLVVAESIEKPGNLGAILRTADGVRVDALLVCDPRVDVWNPNVIRASRGTIFSVPVIICENATALEWLRAKGIFIIAATPGAETVYSQTDLDRPLAIAVGTEDKGLTDFWMKNADLKVRIPMKGNANSLNVSVSTALILYEALRQRTLNDPAE